jgi:predicted NBD/HSP70 family sugar kinase
MLKPTIPSSVAVFDIGGTWFRTGIVNRKGTLSNTFRCPAAHYLDGSGRGPAELQADLVQFLVESVARSRRETDHTISLASISMGAALNSHSGLVYNSGPLWGPACPPFDFLGALRIADPATQWLLFNDITAALAGCSEEFITESVRKLLLITVSTGVGCRLLDVKSARVPVDLDFGLQGEIGHLPVEVKVRGISLNRICDCGGVGHLNAYSSGRGIVNVITSLAKDYPELVAGSLLADARQAVGEFRADQQRVQEMFSTALRAKDELAYEILLACTKPVADILRVALTIDPEIDRIVLTGGLVNSLGEIYFEALAEAFRSGGMYIVLDRDEEFLRKRLRLAQLSDTIGLNGAGVLAFGRWPAFQPYDIKS